MIKCNVSNVAIEITETETLTAGRVGLECQFTFSSEWNGLAITAYFLGETTNAVVVSGNTVVVPAASMVAPGYKLYVGVVGRDAQGNIVIPTLWASAGKIKTSPGEEEEPTPSPDVVAQIQLMAINAVNTANAAMQVITDHYEEIEEVGTEQVAAVNAAGTTQTGNVNTAGATQVAAVEAKGEEVLETIPEDYTTLSNDVSDLKSSISNLRTETHTDLLYGKTKRDGWFIDPSTGVGRALANFFSFEDIEIPSGLMRIFPYYDHNNDKDIRSVCFYTADGTFISGVSGRASYVSDGISVPQNAAKLSCTLVTSLEDGHNGEYYLSTTYGGDVVKYPLEHEVSIDSEQIKYDSVLVNNVRMPCINFQFDDGVSKDENIVSIFDAANMRCGFALISGGNTANYVRYLGYQNKGYEILSHSTDAAGMSDATVDPATIEGKLKTSKTWLESMGFDVKGFVTPNSTMATVFRPILRKYYQWAATTYFGDYSGTGTPYMKPVDGTYNVWRVSLQGTTLANQKAAVDACIANYGCLTFYGHAASLDTTDNLTTENLTALLTYLAGKIANGECVVDTPSKAIDTYFAVRNDDISDGWIPYTAAELELDSRLTTMAWYVYYNPKIKLISINVRLKATEAIAGAFALFKMPVSTKEGQFAQTNTNRECITYNGALTLFGSNTWSENASYRFSGMLKAD